MSGVPALLINEFAAENFRFLPLVLIVTLGTH
jgi:hypothetical protein